MRRRDRARYVREETIYLRANRIGGEFLFWQSGQRNHAVSVYGIDRQVQLGDARVVIGNYETRIVVCNQQHGFFGQPGDCVLRISFVSLEVEDVPNAAFGKLSLFLSDSFKNERVKPIA